MSDDTDEESDQHSFQTHDHQSPPPGQGGHRGDSPPQGQSHTPAGGPQQPPQQSQSTAGAQGRGGHTTTGGQPSGRAGGRTGGQAGGQPEPRGSQRAHQPDTGHSSSRGWSLSLGAMRTQVGRGLALGALAFLAGVCGTYTLLIIDGVTRVGDGEAAVAVASALFFNTLGVPIGITVGAEGVGSSTTVVNLLTDPVVVGATDLTSTVPLVGYRLLPVVCLAGAGAILVRGRDLEGSVVHAAGVGASVVGGFMLAAVTAAIGFLGITMVWSIDTFGDGARALVFPDIGSLLVFVPGTALICGGVGGVAVVLWRRYQTRQTLASAGQD